MPSLQKALPPELADNVLRLYRECLRRAKFIGHQKHNTELLVTMVRQQFKKNMHETDPEKIQKMKDDKGPYQSHSVRVREDDRAQILGLKKVETRLSACAV